jgi:L-ascorbate metabolism protein UlaG (beta-lactamase superfamily)
MSATLTWLGQGGFLVQTDKGSLAVDPFFGNALGSSERLYPPSLKDGSVKVDMVLTTHAHWDHFDPATETYREYVIPQLMVGPGSCMEALEQSGLDIPGKRLDRHQTMEGAGFTITATPADHTPDSVGYIIEADGYKLYISGDALFTTTTIMPHINLHPDISCICINGKLGNMNAYEAASYTKALGSKVSVPMHYDLIRHNTENPQEFVNALAHITPESKGFVMERNVAYLIAEMVG